MFLPVIISCSLQNNAANPESTSDVILTQKYSIKYEGTLGTVEVTEPRLATKQILLPLIGTDIPSKINISLLKPDHVSIPEINLQNIYQIIEMELEHTNQP
jgi:hypothetical protein